MRKRENNGMKKLFTFSSVESKKLIEQILTDDAEMKNTTQSNIMEEFLLKGIIMSHPELKDKVQALYKQNLDPILLGE